ncbi:hypothetical protein TRV_03025 [Trichophyton verrucosum HKI 0517]|uniref:Uncharacterized protein n=1 Tax=Trichophyton verrucosum (strain HKI 0517) TaxID=663202 RepID=D4D7E3_TRIVH|nr:uncharacterized protein TRV_03025 [Trichophyton verrucosum HKI 0517]EFE42183.1 hypothetical protein TRV_03025 [Trichophyton verrucosum HKI 0517]
MKLEETKGKTKKMQVSNPGRNSASREGGDGGRRKHPTKHTLGKKRGKKSTPSKPQEQEKSDRGSRTRSYQTSFSRPCLIRSSSKMFQRPTVIHHLAAGQELNHSPRRPASSVSFVRLVVVVVAVVAVVQLLGRLKRSRPGVIAEGPAYLVINTACQARQASMQTMQTTARELLCHPTTNKNFPLWDSRSLKAPTRQRQQNIRGRRHQAASEKARDGLERPETGDERDPEKKRNYRHCKKNADLRKEKKRETGDNF